MSGEKSNSFFILTWYFYFLGWTGCIDYVYYNWGLAPNKMRHHTANPRWETPSCWQKGFSSCHICKVGAIHLTTMSVSLALCSWIWLVWLVSAKLWLACQYWQFSSIYICKSYILSIGIVHKLLWAMFCLGIDQLTIPSPLMSSRVALTVFCYSWFLDQIELNANWKIMPQLSSSFEWVTTKRCRIRVFEGCLHTLTFCLNHQ